LHFTTLDYTCLKGKLSQPMSSASKKPVRLVELLMAPRKSTITKQPQAHPASSNTSSN